MEPLVGLAWLLFAQSVGEVLSRYFGLPVPGPVIGMILLFFLLFADHLRRTVAGPANFLLQHLSLLFVPVGVGAIQYFSLLSEYGLRLAWVIVLSTWIGLAVTAGVLHALRDRRGDDGDEGNEGGSRRGAGEVSGHA